MHDKTAIIIDEIQIALRENSVPHSKSRVEKLDIVWDYIIKLEKDRDYWKLSFNKQVEASRNAKP